MRVKYSVWSINRQEQGESIELELDVVSPLKLTEVCLSLRDMARTIQDEMRKADKESVLPVGDSVDILE